MKIRFTSSGGFAGLIRGVDIDTDDLPSKERARLHRMVAALEAASVERSRSARDLGAYELEIHADEGSRTFAFDDSNVPSGAQPLVDYLQARSQPRKL